MSGLTSTISPLLHFSLYSTTLVESTTVLVSDMLSKRRSSEAAIQSYLQAESECASEGVTAAAILGTGCFCKRGFGINNWKYRGYYIKEDKKVSD